MSSCRRSLPTRVQWLRLYHQHLTLWYSISDCCYRQRIRERRLQKAHRSVFPFSVFSRHGPPLSFARCGLAFPCRKVTRTLPFLCDFRWEPTENWASSVILPGQDPEPQKSLISGPLHFSSCQRQTRTARRARDPPKGAHQPPDQVPRAGQSPRARGRLARARVAGAPIRRGRRRARMVTSLLALAKEIQAKESQARDSQAGGSHITGGSHIR